MLALVLALALAQSPSPDAEAGKVAVVVSSHRPGAGPWSKGLADRVHAALIREGIPHVLGEEEAATEVKEAGFSDARNCNGGTSCLKKLAVLLGPRAVAVGVDVGKLGSRLAVHLEAVSAVDGSTLAVSDFTASTAKWGDASAVPVTLFARELKEKLPAPPPPSEDVAPQAQATDAPVKPDLVPASTPEPEPAVTAVAEPAPPSRVVPWVLAGGAVVATGAAATFGVLGLSDRNTYESSKYELDGQVGTHLSEPDARALATRSNNRLTLALTSAVLAAGLGAVSTWMFSQD